MVEAMARWHGWEWEHGAANTCRSGTEATLHRRRRSTPDPTNDSLDNGTPKAKDAAKSRVGTPGLCLATISLLAATTKTSLTFAVHTLLPFPRIRSRSG